MKYVIFSIFMSLGILINLSIMNNFFYFKIPIFMINPKLYKIISIVIYLITSIAISKTINNVYKKLIIIIAINFILYTLFNIFTFKILSPFLSFATKTFNFVSSLYLNEELFLQNKKNAKLLAPYILWTFYLTLTSISIFFINNS